MLISAALFHNASIKVWKNPISWILAREIYIVLAKCYQRSSEAFRDTVSA